MQFQLNPHLQEHLDDIARKYMNFQAISLALLGESLQVAGVDWTLCACRRAFMSVCHERRWKHRDYLG